MCGLRVSSSAVQVCVLHGSVVIGRPSWVLFSETSPWGGGDRGPTPRQPGREEPWWMLRGVISLPGSLHRVLCPVTPGLSLRGSPPGCKRLQSGLLLVGVGARCGETLRTRAQGRGDAQDRGAGAGRCSGPRPRGEETLRTGAQGQGDTQDRGPGRGDTQDRGPGETLRSGAQSEETLRTRAQGWGDAQDWGPGETLRTGAQGRRSGLGLRGQPPCHDHRGEVGGL